MRLGIVMMGTGAYAASCAGVLRALGERGIEPYAVCGLHFGAWIAALHVCGYGAEQMSAALAVGAQRGKRLLNAGHTAKTILSGQNTWLSQGKGLGALLRSQTGERMLAFCERKGIFPCRIAESGRRVIFSSVPYAQGEMAALCMQATAGFAARAAMGCPPFLSAMPWLGSVLLPEENVSWAAGQMMRLGAQRVLVIEPRAQPSHEPDSLELALAHRRWAAMDNLPEGTGLLHVPMPVQYSALGFEKMPAFAQAGYDAAQKQIDETLWQMGLSPCRVLPFRKRINKAGCPCR